MKDALRRAIPVLLVAGFGLAGADAAANTLLGPGDLVITGVNADNPDQFVFVPLIDLDAGTTITFTDSGIHADGSFRANEGAVRYSASVDVPAGTAISYPQPATGSFADANDANVGANGFSLSTSGDQVIAFQGDSSNPNFLFAVHTDLGDSG